MLVDTISMNPLDLQEMSPKEVFERIGEIQDEMLALNDQSPRYAEAKREKKEAGRLLAEWALSL